MGKSDLSELYKENTRVIRTICKIGTKEKTEIEVRGFEIFQNLGLPVAPLIYNTDNILTTQFINGVTVFRSIEILSKAKDWNKIYTLLDKLCEGVKVFHDSLVKITIPHQLPYEIQDKISHVVTMSKVLSQPRYYISQNIIDEIEQYFVKNAVYPFRDATPKNYILQGVSEKTVARFEGELVTQIRYIDFAMINRLTLQADDYIGCLFHYMIPDEIRNDLLNKYKINLNEKENIIAAFVRVCRFWVRRHYYEVYKTKLFNKRYLYEDIQFYDKMMMKYTNKLLEIM